MILIASFYFKTHMGGAEGACIMMIMLYVNHIIYSFVSRTNLRHVLMPKVKIPFYQIYLSE